MMAKTNKMDHETALDNLEYMVKNDYSIVMREVLVRSVKTGRIIGEIDLVGIIGNTWDIYEVKANDAYPKAAKQLRNLENYLDNCADLRLFYYSGKEGQIVRVPGKR
ncbi:hypothetical protein HQ545_02765 [Candidatus Woesearchaeota archaeon]|nr:hypothetical protein [Candidatus Woesearchaeota archaeon]